MNDVNESCRRMVADMVERFRAGHRKPGAAPSPVSLPERPVADVSGRHDTYGIEQACQQTWANSPGVRDEFGELARYIAFKKAESRGLVRIIDKRREA